MVNGQLPKSTPLPEEKYRRALGRIVLPKLEVREMVLKDAVEHLGNEAFKIAPKEGRIPFILDPIGGPTMGLQYFPDPSATITIFLPKGTAWETLRDLTSSQNHQFYIRPDGVHIIPIHNTGPEGPMYVRDIAIPPDFFPRWEAQDQVFQLNYARQIRSDIRQFLENKGIEFPPGASVVLNDEGTRLTVRNTFGPKLEIEEVLRELCPAPILKPKDPKWKDIGRNRRATAPLVRSYHLPPVGFPSNEFGPIKPFTPETPTAQETVAARFGFAAGVDKYAGFIVRTRTLEVRDTDEEHARIQKLVEEGWKAYYAMGRKAPLVRPETRAEEWNKEEALEARLRRLIIPKAEFKETKFLEGLDFAIAEARRLDPPFRKIRITMKFEPSADAVVIQDGSGSFTKAAAGPLVAPVKAQGIGSYKNESMLYVLGMATGLSDLKVQVKADGIHIVPKDDPDPMFTRDFRIPPDLYPLRDEEDRRDREEMLAQFKKDPRQFLVDEGIEFQKGAEAIVTDDMARLTARASRHELRAIQALLHPLPQDRSLDDGRKLARTAHMRERMENTVLPSVEFQKVRLDEAVKALEKLSLRHRPETSKAEPIRIQIRQRKRPHGDQPARVVGPSREPFIVGIDPEPGPIVIPADPGTPALPQVTLAAARTSFADALYEIARQARYLVFAAPEGATLVPIETVDEQYFRLPIPPGSYAKLEPVFVQFREGMPVSKTWLDRVGSFGRVVYDRRSRIVRFGGPVGTDAVVRAVEDAWVEFLSKTVTPPKAR